MSDPVVIPASPAHEGKIDVHTLRSGKYAGLKIKLRRIQPLIINKVMESVELPERPTYETRTISGRIEKHPMDSASAKQTPGGEEVWKTYLDETERALVKQNTRSLTAIFVMGTDFEVPNDGWEEFQVALGIDVPDNKDLRRAHFLLTQIEDADEITDITSKIMRLTGVNETIISQAEGAFRDSIHNPPNGSDAVALSSTDPRENTAWELASQ